MTPLAVKVELWISAAWVDITADARVVDGGITIVRGAANEGSTPDPERCSLSLNNRDGRYSPRNPVSPYYGLIGRNTPIRVSVGASIRFSGEVSAFPPTWNTKGTDVWVPLEAAGVLRRISRDSPIGSALRRQYLSVGASVVAYWPMEDEEGATAFGSAVGGPPMQFRGAAPDVAADSSFACSSPLPSFTASGAVGLVPVHATTTVFNVVVLVHIPAGGIVDESTLFAFGCDGGTIRTWSVKFDTAGPGLRLEAFDGDGASLLNFPIGPWATPMGAGSKYAIYVRATTSGANVAWEITGIPIVDGATFPASQFGSGTILGQTKGRVVSVYVAPNLNLAAGTAVGHVMVATANVFTGSVYSSLVAWLGEAAFDRITRLCTEEGIPVTGELGTGVSAAMGPQLPLTLLDLLRECETADRGMLHEARASNSIRYVSRTGLYQDFGFPTSVPLPYSVLSPPMDPTDDDATTQNDVTVSRPSGSSARSTLDTGPLSTQSPPLGVGRYAVPVSANLWLDLQLQTTADWIVHVGTVDESRYPQLHLDLAKNTGLQAAMDGMNVGRWITISALPVWLPPGPTDLIVLGYTEVIGSHYWDMVFNCAPASPYRVAELNDTAFGRLDSAFTTTNEALDTTETGVDYLVAAGSAPWVTTAALPGSFPFDVVIGGEVMTVTAATASTFTVTRSVNGVVKSHLTGAQVRLARPNYVAL